VLKIPRNLTEMSGTASTARMVISEIWNSYPTRKFARPFQFSVGIGSPQ
jgi:hypothetical protein